MEKREGYKKTKIGWIPEEWDIVKFEDTADKTDRYSIAGGPFGSDLKSEHYTESGVRIVQLQNIGDGSFLNDYHIFTSEEKADELKKCNGYPGEIIIAKMAEPLARACKFPNNDNRYLMCSDGIRLKVNLSKFDNNYVLYTINSKYFRKITEANGTGTTRLRIGLKTLKSLPVLSPPLPEQQKIASILSTVDDKISSIEHQIQQTEQLKKGLMGKLLTEGIGHTEFKDTKIGWIPEEWDCIKTESILEKKKGAMKIGPFGSQLKKSFFVKDGYKVYGQKNIYSNDFQIGNRYIDFERFEALKTCKIQPGDFLISMMGTIGKCSIAPDDIEIGIMDSHLLRLQIDTILYSKNLLTHLFSSDFIIKQIKRLSVGGIMDGLSSAIVKSLNFPIPPLPEQQKIASILSTVDDKIEVLNQKKSEYQTLKKGLSQQLLTGQMRVKV